LFGLLVDFLEQLELAVVGAPGDVEGPREDGGGVDVLEREVAAQVVEEGLFVADEVVAGEVVVDFQF
jgi:hypothetical protein